VLLLYQLRPATGENTAILDEAVSLAQQASAQVRQIYKDSGLSILEFVGLVDTLDWLFERFRQETGIEVDYEECGGDGSPPFSVSLAAFRIIEEYLEGCRRITAARPQKLAISRGLEAGFIILDLSGHGSADVDRECLLYISERARMAGGTVTVASAPAAVTIRVAIPLNP
jgi:signal transduction histidine kinase